MLFVTLDQCKKCQNQIDSSAILRLLDLNYKIFEKTQLFNQWQTFDKKIHLLFTWMTVFFPQLFCPILWCLFIYRIWNWQKWLEKEKWKKKILGATKNNLKLRSVKLYTKLNKIFVWKMIQAARKKSCDWWWIIVLESVLVALINFFSK